MADVAAATTTQSSLKRAVRDATVRSHGTGQLYVLPRVALGQVLRQFPNEQARVRSAMETLNDYGYVLPGFLAVTQQAVSHLELLFASVDVDQSGDLSQSEVIKLLRKLGLYTSYDDAMLIIHDMDADNSGTVDMREWISAIDRRMAALPLQARHSLMRGFNTTKTGFAGTTWRTEANTIWVMTSGVLIMTISAVCVGVVYFNFILVPLTTAYFLTYLLGPVFDLFYQRPLLCFGAPLCYNEDQDDKESHKRCCNVNKFGDHWTDGETPLGCSGFASMQRTIADIFFLLRLPQSVALLLTLAIAFGSVGLLTYAIYTQVVGLLYTGETWVSEDAVCSDGRGRCSHAWSPETCPEWATDQELCENPEFMLSFRDKINKLRKRLLEEYYVVLEELEPSNSSLDNPTHYNMSSSASFLLPAVDFVNECILILLLCIYMLSTRQMMTVDDYFCERERPHEMTLMQKIESSIRHYIVLKTEISAITGAAVMLVLGVIGVKLWLVWGVLTFILNFIPNVGSMIAIFMPMPGALSTEPQPSQPVS